MQKIRYGIAVIAGKITSLLLKLFHKKIPYYPGYIALRICPNFLDITKKPNKVIAITGTNGKSTIASLLTDAFESLGYRVMNNNGFNVKDGITAMFLQDISLFHKRAEVMILEVDEKSSKMIFSSIPPQYLICTNLFRDSMRGNSNIDYIASKIKEGIPESTKLILCGDDMITASKLGKENTIYYSLLKMDGEGDKIYNLSCDLVYCPNCGEKLIFDDVHYHHIGHLHCPNCSFKNPKSKYVGELKGDEILVNGVPYPVKNKSIFNLYNLLSVISLFKELNFPDTKIQTLLENLKITDSRYSKEVINGITLVNHMAKGQNPVASSSVFDYVRKEPGTKDIFLILDDVHDKKYSVETVAWYYDTDFEFLNDSLIKHIVIGGVRAYDVYVRCLFAGIPKEKLCVVEDEFKMYNKISFKEDAIYLLHDIHQYDQSLIIKEQIKEEILK